jgi:hypothetical protein
VISDYLDSLVGALSFDRPLSGRVRQEVEDHLREAVAADPATMDPRHSAVRLPISAILVSSRPSSPWSR